MGEYYTWAGKRPPTEAEWEYETRSGLTGKRYPWRDTISRADANYLNSRYPWYNDTSPVEYYAPDGYGLGDFKHRYSIESIKKSHLQAASISAIYSWPGKAEIVGLFKRKVKKDFSRGPGLFFLCGLLSDNHQ